MNRNSYRRSTRPPVLLKGNVMTGISENLAWIVALGFFLLMRLQSQNSRKRYRGKLLNIRACIICIHDPGEGDTGLVSWKDILKGELAPLIKGEVNGKELPDRISICVDRLSRWASDLHKNRQPEEARKIEPLIVTLLSITR